MRPAGKGILPFGTGCRPWCEAPLACRTAEEYAAGHVPKAANVPVMVKQGGAFVPNPDFLRQVGMAVWPRWYWCSVCPAGGDAL